MVTHQSSVPEHTAENDAFILIVLYEKVFLLLIYVFFTLSQIRIVHVYLSLKLVFGPTTHSSTVYHGGQNGLMGVKKDVSKSIWGRIYL